MTMQPTVTSTPARFVYRVRPWLASIAAIALTVNASPGRAESLVDLQQLLRDNTCTSCDLSNAGLVYADLAGADLAGANLVRANLSQSSLTGATLAGANLRGATLAGADLTGVDFRNADLSGADLRGAYLTDADFTDADLSGVNLRGAMGIPAMLVSIADLRQWGDELAGRGNYTGAIDYYTQALQLDPDDGEIYLARGVAYSYLGDLELATTDAETASELFFTAGNQEGYQLANVFVATIEAEAEAADESQSGRNRGDIGGNLLNVITGIGSILLQGLL